MNAKELKELLNDFFEEIFDKSDLAELKEKGDDALGYGFTNVNLSSKDLYEFYSDESKFNKYFIENEDVYLMNDAIEYMAKYVYYDVFNFCGCGLPDSMKEFICKCLNLFNRSNRFYRDGEEPKMFNTEQVQETFGFDIYNVELDENGSPGTQWMTMYFIMYQFDALGLSEHGTSITGAWLSKKGITVRRILNEWIKIQDNEEDKS